MLCNTFRYKVLIALFRNNYDTIQPLPNPVYDTIQAGFGELRYSSEPNYDTIQQIAIHFSTALPG